MQKAIVTSRILFISVLDKIFLGILGLCFIGGTLKIFNGSISSLYYNFFGRVGKEIVFITLLGLLYLLLNWVYKCAAKTMLCLTKNEVYKEEYIPFKETKTTIPLNKITSVSTLTIFWIFRAVIICQYHKLPLVFPTWNHKEFKDKLRTLLTEDEKTIENDYENKNIITEDMYKYLKNIGIALAGLLLLLGIVRFFAYIFNGERKIAGTYTKEDNKIILNKNGTCSFERLIERVTDCKWNYNANNKEVKITYEYEYSYYYNRYTSVGKSNLILKYNVDDKSLEYKDMKFTK